MKVITLLQERKFHLISLVLLVIIAYANSLPAVFISDDIPSISQDPNIGNIATLFHDPLNLVQPLIYFIIYILFGAHPLPFRLVNILFHIGNVFLIYAIITRLWNKTVAFMSASLFAVHPILTESITWISGGHYVRYGFFFFLTFYLYLRTLKEKKFLIPSLISCLLAIQSSALAVIIPFKFVVLTLIQEKSKRNFKMLIPYFVITGVGIVALYLLGYAGRANYLSDVNSQYTAFGAYNYNPLFLIPAQFTTYLQLIIFPLTLTFYHSEIFTYQDIFIRSLVCLLYVIAMVIFYKKNKLIFFWLCFFVLALLVVLSPIQVASSSIAERYVYVAALGIIAPIGYFLYWISKKNLALGWGLFGVFLLLLTVRTIVRNNDWLTYESFWTSTLATSPYSYQAHMNVGSIYYKNGDYQNAIIEFKKSLVLMPNPQTHYNLATIYYAAGNLNGALLEYEKALSLDPKMPEVYQNMAAIYFQEGNLKRAEELTKKALSLAPNNSNTLVNLAIIYLQEGRKSEAKILFQQVLSIDPTNAQAQKGLENANR